MPAAGEWSGVEQRKTFPDCQHSHYAVTCVTNVLEQPLGCCELCPDSFQILIRMTCILGLLFSLFISDEHQLEAKTYKFILHFL